MNTDTLVADKIAEYLSEETGILCTPTVNYGVNLPCDRFYAGTCSTTKEALTTFLAPIVDWWKLQEFRQFFLLSAHGDPYHIAALNAIDPPCIKKIVCLNETPCAPVAARTNF